MALVGDLNENNMKFVGKAGSFCPMEPGTGGGYLLREKDGKFFSATGAKNWFWLEAEMVKTLGLENQIEGKYFERLVDEAITQVRKYGDFEWFVS